MQLWQQCSAVIAASILPLKAHKTHTVKYDFTFLYSARAAALLLTN